MKTTHRASDKLKRAAGKKLSAAKIARRYLEVQRLREQVLRAQSAASAG